MGINFSTGEITAQPHMLEAGEFFKTPGQLNHGAVAYVEMEAWFADADGQMWLSATSSVFSEEDVESFVDGEYGQTKEGIVVDEDRLCRIICLEIADADGKELIKGFVLDTSADEFTIEDGAENKITRSEVAYKTIAQAAMDNCMPIFGLARNEAELEAIKPILAKHKIVLPASVIETISEDEQGQGDV